MSAMGSTVYFIHDTPIVLKSESSVMWDADAFGCHSPQMAPMDQAGRMQNIPEKDMEAMKGMFERKYLSR